ncbi:MAG TPA: hypothetical protein VGN75_15135 [Kaistia sp.]|jgi:hypothetical protein|nr:hypothetical protein [Kaistia sp.]
MTAPAPGNRRRASSLRAGPIAQHLIEEQLPTIAGAAIASDPRPQALPYVTALEIATAEGVPPARKRRGLVTRMSARMRWYYNSLEMCPLPDGRGAWMFLRQVVGPWLDHGGRALIQEHKAAVASRAYCRSSGGGRESFDREG